MNPTITELSEKFGELQEFFCDINAFIDCSFYNGYKIVIHRTMNHALHFIGNIFGRS